MRRIVIAALVALAAPLGACATFQPGAPGPLAATEGDEKVVGLIEASYELAARSYIGFVNAGGVARGSPVAVRIAEIDARIQPKLELLRRVRKAGDQASAAALAAELGPLVVELVAAVNAIGGRP